MAYFIGPDPAEQPKPSVFVCNVGELERGPDALAIATATAEMSASLQLPQAAREGFAGQYLANIPTYGRRRDAPWHLRLAARLGLPTGYRQLNLTAWSSAGAAHGWYVDNPNHQAIVHAHRTGMLTSFNSAVAHLVPTKRVRWDARCRSCALPNPDYPTQRTCVHCGDALPEMPLF